MGIVIRRGPVYVVVCTLATMLLCYYISKANKVKTGPHDWILTSYKRSGSSITGQLLGHRQDTFYWFEPLNELHRHFWSQDKICYDETDGKNCRPPTNREISTDEAIGFINQILTCNFSSLAKLSKLFSTSIHSGIHWTQFEECIKETTMGDGVRQACLTEQESLCKAASHRGAKVLRLVLDNFARLLEANEKLKVIHLFRDPRAVLNSWETTKTYGALSYEALFEVKINETGALCNRMLYEARVASILREMYPKRFGIIFYEDLFRNVKQNLRGLYSFLGVRESETNWEQFAVGVVHKRTHKLSYEKTDKDFRYWWRTRMNYTLVKAVDTVCKDVYDVLGFVPVENERMLRDITIDLHKFDAECQIDNISSGKPYNTLACQELNTNTTPTKTCYN